MNCTAIYTVNEELHACLKPNDHRGKHKTRFTTTLTTDYGIPILLSEVEMKWTRWSPTDYDGANG
jgi:hypothetical protein